MTASATTSPHARRNVAQPLDTGRTRPAHRVVARLKGGIESIRRVPCEHGCPIAPSTYYAALHDTAPRSARQRHDEALKAEIVRVHEDNFGAYGARKVWLQLNRKGIAVARCTASATGGSCRVRAREEAAGQRREPGSGIHTADRRTLVRGGLPNRTQR
ncbi:IS3 family transposase [Pseudonocardia humida]|uniref:IS3 family transposase n=1 Tax=Pseudonocardia humida TaxID=2800819 RepID=A0ABT1A9R9_9PSEU|nr:IS3 family transposase [Pseudonocardia humida]